MGLRRWWDITAGLLIVLGLMQVPGDMILAGDLGAGRLWWLGVAAVVDLVPALPFVLALDGLMGWRPGFIAVGVFIAVSVLPALMLTFAAA